jgi:hypothetical protein
VLIRFYTNGNKSGEILHCHCLSLKAIYKDTTGEGIVLIVSHFLISLIRLVILNSYKGKGLEIHYTSNIKLYTILPDDFLTKGLWNSLKEPKCLGIIF